MGVGADLRRSGGAADWEMLMNPRTSEIAIVPETLAGLETASENLILLECRGVCNISKAGGIG
jgi:hypothetical protein